MDNLQVTVGAYNAVFQLECSPLREMILNPAVLLKSIYKTPTQNVPIDVPKGTMQKKKKLILNKRIQLNKFLSSFV